MKNKKIVLAIILALVIVIAGSSIFFFIMTRRTADEYAAPFTKADGTDCMVKVPEKTKHIDTFGFTVMKFESEISKEEIKKFYDNYFSNLLTVYGNGDINNEEYYDDSQKLILGQLDIWNEDDSGKTYFVIGVDYCEDIYSNTYYKILNNKSG